MERGTEEEAYLWERHLENNTFEDGEMEERGAGDSQDLHEMRDEARNSYSDGGRGRFIESEEVRVVAVRIRDGRVADWRGEVRDWCLSGEENGTGEGILINGA